MTAAVLLWEYRQHVLVTVGVAIGAVLLWMLIASSIEAHNNWVAWCQSVGGHVISDTDTRIGTGIDSKGNAVTTTTTSTDYFCLNETGGIVDIR